MANILSTSQIVQRFLDFYRIAQPNLDTKPGTVSRDLLVDAIAVRIAEIYNEMLKVSASQSLSKSVGSDLDNLGSNYAVAKLEAGTATGPALLTFNSLSTDIPIGTGAMAYARNGVSFRIISGVVISASNEGQYRALATTYRDDLDFVGITDNYAMEVVVEATTTGTQGNISKYALTSISIPGISNITNVVPFTGGTSAENDASYRSRILAVFSGSNTGTEVGYRNLVLADGAVLDAIVVGPGDSLMTRDDSIQQTDDNGDLVLDSNGDPIIISEGTGGKVDVFVYGRRLVQDIDSYIYNDRSGQDDPTNSSNDHTIGQIPGDENKTITRRRYENIKSGSLPNQPVVNILEVIGSRSGIFSPQVIDENGNSIGNYTLLKDTGTYAESVFGFDKLHWSNSYISTSEDLSKNQFNGQDPLLYSDITKMSGIGRTINVTNENSAVVTTNNSQLQLSHTPVNTINKVLNATTGERYIVSDRNPNGDSENLNTTGLITISGSNLPASSDTLQVDYEWSYLHDPFIDFDSFQLKDNPRTAIDVIDWGYNNAIRREEETVDEGYAITVQHNINSVISVNLVVTETGTVSVSSSGENFIVDNLVNVVSNVVSVRKVDGAELYNTTSYDGTFDGKRITLPTDTSAQNGDSVVVVYNAFDLFHVDGSTGTFSNNVITLVQSAAAYVPLYSVVECNYIANISELLPSTNMSNLPAVKLQNKFTLNGLVGNFGVQPFTNIYSGTSVIKNLRKSPSKLNINVSGTTQAGLITVVGETATLVQNSVLTSTSSGLTVELSLFIKNALGIDFTQSLPSNVKLMKLVSLEKVQTISNNVVTDVTTTYDVTGYSLNDNSFDLDTTAKDTSLSNTKVKLPTTTTNVADPPLVGDKLRATFYILKTTDTENVSFSTNGTLFTAKTFAFIDSVSISSGFKSGTSLVGAITISAMNQPSSGSRYRSTYNYTAPKNAERITIRYNTNSLVGDLTLLLEPQRALTADVVIKSASSVLIDVTATIIVLSEYEKTKVIIGQNVGDRISNYINNLDLGGRLHPSDLINVAYQVAGLDSITLFRFNKSDTTGNASVINALKNQYMQANTIIIRV